MRHFNSTLFALAAIAPAALADFRIYVGGGTGVSEGGASTSNDMYILPNEPDCNDVANYHSPVANPNNDASSGGWACDGCDGGQNAADWTITRFEFYNGDDAIGAATDDPFPILDIATGGTTCYDTGNGNYDLHDGDDNIIGTCTRVTDPDTAFCSQFITNESIINIINCVSDRVPNSRTVTG